MSETGLLRLEGRVRWARLPLAILSGGVMAMGQAPWDMAWLALAGLIAAFLVFSSVRTPLNAVGAGWGVGLGYFGIALAWVVEPFQVDAAATAWMAPFALFLLAAGLALFWGIAFWGAGHAPPRRRLFALAFTWALAELARAYIFTGFPWAMVGYLWAPTDVIQWVSVVGPHGLTLLTLALAALSATAFGAGRRALLPGAVAAVALAALVVGGEAMVPPLQDSTGRPVVRLVQPNAPQVQKWDRDWVPVFFRRQVDFTAAPATEGLERPSLVVWPETAVPMLLDNADEALGVITDAAYPARVVLGIQREDEPV